MKKIETPTKLNDATYSYHPIAVGNVLLKNILDEEKEKDILVRSDLELYELYEKVEKEVGLEMIL